MSNARTIIERAFDIANMGDCASSHQIVDKLKAEGFSGRMIEGHMDGHSLRTQLNDLCRSAQAKVAKA